MQLVFHACWLMFAMVNKLFSVHNLLNIEKSSFFRYKLLQLQRDHIVNFHHFMLFAVPQLRYISFGIVIIGVNILIEILGLDVKWVYELLEILEALALPKSRQLMAVGHNYHAPLKMIIYVEECASVCWMFFGRLTQPNLCLTPPICSGLAAWTLIRSGYTILPRCSVVMSIW